MRVACVLVTHFRARAEMLRHPHLKNSPVLIVDRDTSRGRPLVVDGFPPRVESVTGLTLEQALSRNANVLVMDADEPHYRRVFGEVLSSLQRVSDRVEGTELGTAYVRLDSLESMYHGEAGVVSALLKAVPAYLNPRIGVADVKFPAFVAARMCKTHGATRVPDDVTAFLAPHSISLLPVPADVKAEMRRFGLRTMGDLASMGEHALVDQFGREGGRAWRLCNGMDDTPVVPLPFDESIVERASLPFSSSSLQALFVAVDTLLRRAYSRSEMKGKYVGTATLLCSASGWSPWEKVISFREPAGTWERASFVVRSRMEADPPHVPVEEVILTLSNLTGESGTQMGLLKDAQDDTRRRLEDVNRRLQARTGDHALYRIVEVAPWHPVPEMRALQVPIDPSGRDAIRSLHQPSPVEVREGAKHEPVSVRVKERWQRVARIQDSWTFDLWWLSEPVSRAYYRIDPGDGKLVTLFRDQGDDRWYRQAA
ncbi:MAG: hypothetical protein F4Z29_06505 [Gemmatimonadetes bacterium]|nr:hypothetical protein [Gemmatimonadota bacterium]